MAVSPPSVQILRGAFLWESGFAVDADGSPKAYAPPGSPLRGLDSIDNAGSVGDWFGAVTNSSGALVIQGPNDPAPGYCVSPTSLCDHSKAARDPARYVDASTVPYLAIPPELRNRGVCFGDIGVAIYKGRVAGAICADGSPHGHYGEGSIALADMLGIPSSPRNGGASWGVTFLVFPRSYSSPAWPRTLDSIQSQAVAMFSAWGGIAGVPWMAPNV